MAPVNHERTISVMELPLFVLSMCTCFTCFILNVIVAETCDISRAQACYPVTSTLHEVHMYASTTSREFCWKLVSFSYSKSFLSLMEN